MSRVLRAAALGAPLLAVSLPAQAADRLFVSGRDALVADDLATGLELARFATPGISADMVALESGHILLNHRDGNAVLVVEARAIEAAIIAATDACDVGDPAAGARQAVEIARLAGRIEARSR